MWRWAILKKVQGQNLKQSTFFLLNRRTQVLLAYSERRRWNVLPGKFSEELEQGWSVHSVHRCASLKKANLWGMIWGQANLGNVSKAGKPPMKQSKKSVLMCEIMYAMFKESW
jgi:hypothetical protein